MRELKEYLIQMSGFVVDWYVWGQAVGGYKKNDQEMPLRLFPGDVCITYTTQPLCDPDYSECLQRHGKMHRCWAMSGVFY
jgi:hypothetical protein